MTLTVNFQTETYPEEHLSVRDLLERKHWSFPLIIVRVNGVLVQRNSYGEKILDDGDEVALYHLMSGG